MSNLAYPTPTKEEMGAIAAEWREHAIERAAAYEERHGKECLIRRIDEEPVFLSAADLDWKLWDYASRSIRSDFSVSSCLLALPKGGELFIERDGRVWAVQANGMEAVGHIHRDYCEMDIALLVLPRGEEEIVDEILQVLRTNDLESVLLRFSVTSRGLRLESEKKQDGWTYYITGRNSFTGRVSDAMPLGAHVYRLVQLVSALEELEKREAA